MARLLYTLAGYLLLPWALAHLLWRARRQPEYLRHWRERFAYYGGGRAAPSPLLWIHAVSVGETRAAEPLLALLQAHYPEHRILLTHTTPTGRTVGETLYGERVARAYLPYDTPGATQRFLRHFRPVLGVLMETEIWPNLIAACGAREIPLLLANARLSARSARRYALLPTLTRAALQGLSGIAAQSEEDAQRLRQLGATSVVVSGNLKFDSTPAPELLARGRDWRRRWGLTTRPVLLAASTREGEEQLLLEALRHQPVADLLLIIVPRHPQRFAAVAALATQFGYPVQQRSHIGTDADPDVAALAPTTQVLLGDSMGELSAYYAASDVAIIGGSLLDYGSQNLIEACAVGTPVLLGPSTYNFSWAAAAALACGAARQEADAAALLRTAAALLADPAVRQRMADAGLQFSAGHRGASQRTLRLLTSLLPR